MPSRRSITRSGFVTDDIGSRFGGDIAAAGEIAHIQLLLWDQCRDLTLLDDIERIVRARLLPAQVRERLPLKPRRESEDDSCCDLAKRFLGTIGGAVGHVIGQSCVPDMTAAAVHSLVEVYNRIVDRDNHGLHVNFHLDYDGPDVHIRSVRQDGGARLLVENDAGNDVFIRIPGWAPVDSLQLLVNERPIELEQAAGFVHYSGTGTPVWLEFTYELPEFTDTEEWRDEDATEAVATFHWRGDDIVSVDPVGDYMAPHAKACTSIIGWQ